ncbi:uncharacterized protein YALI1_E27805g [Yarrowia lipolytica]|uniref:Uncharacterized protein n=1 Tax=Yarrowia lipolytica TaxID=4952 RepID=A0A1D8NJN3_YARLL|nr:hypothetical protein YALI1_E27805g [Yarrowia lipolytica]
MRECHRRLQSTQTEAEPGTLETTIHTQSAETIRKQNPILTEINGPGFSETFLATSPFPHDLVLCLLLLSLAFVSCFCLLLLSLAVVFCLSSICTLRRPVALRIPFSVSKKAKCTSAVDECGLFYDKTLLRQVVAPRNKACTVRGRQHACARQEPSDAWTDDRLLFWWSRIVPA